MIIKSIDLWQQRQEREALTTHLLHEDPSATHRIQTSAATKVLRAGCDKRMLNKEKTVYNLNRSYFKSHYI